MDTATRVRIKRQFTVIGHSPDRVEIRSGVWNPTSYTLTDDSASGRLYTLISGLDGSVSPDDLAERHGVTGPEMQALVGQLRQFGVLEEGPTTALDAYVDAYARPLKQQPVKPETKPVLVLAEDELRDAVVGHLAPVLGENLHVPEPGHPGHELLSRPDTGWLSDELTFQSKLELFEDWRDHHVLILTTAPDPVFATGFNRVALELGITSLHATLDGPFLLVGPTVVPNRGACYQCFETRVTMNLREAGSYQRYKEAMLKAHLRAGRPEFQSAILGLLASHSALETMNFLSTGTTFTYGKVLSIYLPTMEFSFNDVTRLPACRACGSLAGREDEQLSFDVGQWLVGSAK